MHNRRGIHTDFLRRTERIAFERVMEAYNQARSVAGQTQAIDYTRMGSGAQGAQYNPDVGQQGFRVIDFVVDVLAAVRDTLDTQEMQFFFDTLQDKNFDMTVQSEEFMRMQERLGRAFMGRKLYPVQKYFIHVKKGKGDGKRAA